MNSIPTEESIKQYKIDIQSKVNEILNSLDEHKLDSTHIHSLTEPNSDDRIYPTIIMTLVDNDNYGEVFSSGTTTDDAWFTFLDNVEREEDFMHIGLDNYNKLLKIKPYEYDHELQGKLIELYCFAYDLDWDFIHKVWGLHDD
tara:strand:+ start:602 stop:1030 length:429 start_codon:yes stop_codon:yes gene_type:complete